MIIIRFNDLEAKKKAIGHLAGRFRFTTWSSGEMLVPDEALPFLARERIRFSVDGPATYDQAIPPLRHLASAQVQ